MYSDSLLVINPTNGEYEAKEKQVVSYLGLTWKHMSKFGKIHINHIIDHENNDRAYAWSKVALLLTLESSTDLVEAIDIEPYPKHVQ